jgi:hypothetical protein
MYMTVQSGFCVFKHHSKFAGVLQTGPAKNGRITIALRIANRHYIPMIFRNFFRVVIVYALVLGVLALPGVVSGLHFVVPFETDEATRHQALNPVQTVDDSHSHDDGEDYEQKAGHSHGHDPADHSHQVVFMSHTVFADVEIGSDTPLARVPDLIKLETDFAIDRPPKGAQRA